MNEVGQLKHLLLDDSDIVSLVRFALYLAKKFNESEMIIFFSNELNGYPESPFPPYYRVVTGTWKIKRKMAKPASIEFPENLNCLNGKIIRDGIPKILSFMSSFEDYLFFKQDDKSKDQELRRCIRNQFPSLANNEIYLAVHRSEFLNIFDQIKAKTLDWIINLEHKGILGDEIKLKESVIMQNNFIQNGNGNNQANVNESPNSTVNQTSKNVFKGDFNSLANKLKDYGVEDKDIQDLKNVIDVTPTPTSSDELGEGVTNWLGKMSLKALKGSLKVGKDVAMGVLVEAITTYYCG